MDNINENDFHLDLNWMNKEKKSFEEFFINNFLRQNYF